MLVGRWASEVPRFTVVNIGACDLANTGFGYVQSEESLAQRYGKMVHEWIPKFLKAAWETCKTLKQKYYFREGLRMHRWVILKVPSWGSEDEAIRGMTAQEFRRLRNKVIRRS